MAAGLFKTSILLHQINNIYAIFYLLNFIGHSVFTVA
jgi:hypothetical protein